MLNFALNTLVPHSFILAIYQKDAPLLHYPYLLQNNKYENTTYSFRELPVP